jgi:hypothetical protein
MNCNLCGIELAGGRWFSEAAPELGWCSFECSADDPAGDGGPWGFELGELPTLGNMARAVWAEACYQRMGVDWDREAFAWWASPWPARCGYFVRDHQWRRSSWRYRRCKRPPAVGSLYCRQHAAKVAGGEPGPGPGRRRRRRP